MMVTRTLAAYRKQIWRIGKVRAEAQFKALLDRLGLCLIFGSEDIPLPKVYDVSHDDSENWWNWKDHLQAKRQAYLGRVIRDKATLISMKLLPAFLTLYYAHGGAASYDEEHFYGRLTQEAKWICDELDRSGPLAADRLRKRMKGHRGMSTSAYHKALLELQRKFKIVTVGLIERNWGTRVIGLFESWVPASVEKQAQSLDPQKARITILKALLTAAGGLSVPQMVRLTGWTENELTPAMEALLREGKARRATSGGKLFIIQ